MGSGKRQDGESDRKSGVTGVCKADGLGRGLFCRRQARWWRVQTVSDWGEPRGDWEHDYRNGGGRGQKLCGVVGRGHGRNGPRRDIRRIHVRDRVARVIGPDSSIDGGRDDGTGMG